MLDSSGELRSDATLDLANGTTLHVAGVLESNSYNGPTPAAHLPVPPTSVLRGNRAPYNFLVDLPTMTTAQTHELVAALTDRGVAMTPRDVIFHPRAWGARTSPPSPVDPQSLAIGALIVLFGLIEVVLIVGSAFAVSARRQVRDLGLLAPSGGSPRTYAGSCSRRARPRRGRICSGGRPPESACSWWACRSTSRSPPRPCGPVTSRACRWSA